MNDRRGPPPAFVPVLTEVLELADLAVLAPRAEPPFEAPYEPPYEAQAEPAYEAQAEPAPELAEFITPASFEPTLDEARFTTQVLADLRLRVDSMLEYRLREALAPLLAQAADDMVEQARTELAATLRDVVARAVAQEMARHRNRA